ncbi:MAG: hypothetical protein ACYTG6_04030 [Planctomycetota bacterium]|jgi:hypothetical protein
MSVANLDAAIVMDTLKEMVSPFAPTFSDVDEEGDDRIVPRDVRQWLARLRLLEGVPFAYLVPDSELLPRESIRFFYLDRAWTDALVQGALSVGTVNSSDRAQLEQLHKPVRNELDEEERRVRLPGSEKVQKGTAGTISGFLLRSRAVSGWPGLHVRAYRRDVVGDREVVPESHPDRIKLLRLERLAPAVLFALFDGVPQLVHVEEPRQGLQFGVRPQQVAGDNANHIGAEVVARDKNTAKDLEPEKRIPVFFRRGAPGVLDLRRTGEEFTATAGTNMSTTLDGAEFALQMIRFPYRQVFGKIDDARADLLTDVFRPTVKFQLSELKTKFQEVVSRG